MTLELFARYITEKEISAREKELDINHSIRQKSIDEDAETSKDIDQALLDAVLKMICISKEQLHISCGIENTVIPLLSLYISGGRIISFEYRKQGIKISELMALQDVKNVLVKYMAVLPLYDRSADSEKPIAEAPEEVMQRFLQQDRKKKLFAQCITSGANGPRYLLKDGDAHLDGLILGEKNIQTKGSAFPVFRAMTEFVLMQYKKTIKP